MADLDSATGAALNRSLSRVLSVELRRPLTCRDISAEGQRWDLEAINASGAVVRRVSHVTTIVPRMAKAMAELRDVRRSFEQAAAELSVRGVCLSLNTRQLPYTQRERCAIGVELAKRVDKFQRTGQPILVDPISAVRSGRHPFADPLALAISDVQPIVVPADTPARVWLSSDDRLSHLIPDLWEEVLPTIAEKRQRHAEFSSQLTLVVQAVNAQATRGAVKRIAQHLEGEHLGFKSVYAGRYTGMHFPIWRVY